MKYLITGAILLATTSIARAEDFTSERAICQRHPNTGALFAGAKDRGRYDPTFRKLCDAADARFKAVAAASAAATNAADLATLQSLAPATPAPTPAASPTPSTTAGK